VEWNDALESPGTFYHLVVNSNHWDWLKNARDNQLTWSAGDSKGGRGSHYNNPCPPGWLIPSKSKIQELVGKGKWDPKGWYVIPADYPIGAKLFLPAAGSLSPDDAGLEYVGSEGFYWSSSAEPDEDENDGFFQISPKALEFNDQRIRVSDGYTPRGGSVRCISSPDEFK
jgi:hypothetical protein